MDASLIQQQYYKETAENYDQQHLSDNVDPEQRIALAWLEMIIKLYNIKSILDIGAGTGRTIAQLKHKFPDIRIVGIEPVKELREIGYAKGIKPTDLADGNGNALGYRDNEFDLVCEFAVLHHVPKPGQVISEMMRVASKGIFISDTNNYGQGSKASRLLKKTVKNLGLWNVYRYIITRGKMYHITEGDGLFYSYSLFNNYRQIKSVFKNVQVLSYPETGINPLYNSEHAALFALNKF